MISIRITHEDDITSDETIKWLASMVSPENHTVIWFTPPVAGGTHVTRSQSMRSRRATKQKNGEEKVFRRIWFAFAVVYDLVRECNPIVCIDMPRNSAYWHSGYVSNFLSRNGFWDAVIQGCELGLVVPSGSEKGYALGWAGRISTNDETVARLLCLECSGNHGRRGPGRRIGPHKG